VLKLATLPAVGIGKLGVAEEPDIDLLGNRKSRLAKLLFDSGVQSIGRAYARLDLWQFGKTVRYHYP